MVYRRFGVKVQNTYEMCKVLVGTPIPLDVDALAAIIPPDRTPGGNCVVKLLAIAAPVPSPDSLGSDVNCKVATFSSWDLSRGPRCTVVTTWGRVARVGLVQQFQECKALPLC